jgi:hypothetical protein
VSFESEFTVLPGNLPSDLHDQPNLFQKVIQTPCLAVLAVRMSEKCPSRCKVTLWQYPVRSCSSCTMYEVSILYDGIHVFTVKDRVLEITVYVDFLTQLSIPFNSYDYLHTQILLPCFLSGSLISTPTSIGIHTHTHSFSPWNLQHSFCLTRS